MQTSIPGRRSWCAAFWVLASYGCATSSSVAPAAPTWTSTLSVDHPLTGKIWDVAAQRFVDEPALRARALETPLILVGEKHDNPDHHRLQARVVGWVAERRPAVVFEMLDTSLRDRIDEQLAENPKSADALARAVAWDASGWPDFAMYRPIFVTALDAGLPIVPGNLPRSEAMSIARGQAEPAPELATRFHLDRPLPKALHDDLVKNLKDGHCGMLPDQMIGPMIEVQRVRDAVMADALLSGGGPAVLIAGGGHVRKDRGVPWYLAGQGREDILAIGLTEVDPEENDPPAGEPFDYLWFTPRANDIDHCAELEKTLERMKKKKPKD